MSEQPVAHSPMLASLLMDVAGPKQDYVSVPAMSDVQGERLQRTLPTNTCPGVPGMSYPWDIKSPG